MREKKNGRCGSVFDAIPDDKEYWEVGDCLFLGAHMINDPN